jgi:cytochrome b561
MQWRNTRDRWGAVAQSFHWLIAVLILGTMVLGWVMVYWPVGPTQFSLYALHKSIGLTVFALVVLRLGWRLASTAPELPAQMPHWERRAAHGAHVLLYLLIIAMPVSGYLINAGAGFPLTWFGLVRIPSPSEGSEWLESVASAVHLTLFWTLLAVLALHVFGALRHHFVLKDDVLSRMLPRRSR